MTDGKRQGKQTSATEFDREPTTQSMRWVLHTSESNCIAQRGRATINQRAMSDHKQQNSNHDPTIDELIEDGSYLEENGESELYSNSQLISEEMSNHGDEAVVIESCCYSVSPLSLATPRIDSLQSRQRFIRDQQPIRYNKDNLKTDEHDDSNNDDNDEGEESLPPIDLETLDSVEIGSGNNDTTREEHWDNELMLFNNNIRTTNNVLYENGSNISKCLLSLNQSLNQIGSPQTHSHVSGEADSESIVTLCIYCPHLPKGRSFDGVIQCRVLVLQVPIIQSVEDLVEASISTEYITKLPNVIQAFKVPQNAIVALEFFRADDIDGISSHVLCEGRVFIPSYLFHLVASKDLYIPTSSEKCLSHIIPNYSFDSVTVELPLGLCSSNLAPPIDESDAENSFIFIAEQIESGYNEICPIARFTINYCPSVMSISPRTSIRLRCSPREPFSSKYTSHLDQCLSISVSPPLSYRHSIVNPDARPNSRSSTRPPVPRLRYIPPPLSGVSLSPQDETRRTKQRHSKTTHSYKTHDRDRKSNNDALMIPSDVYDFEMSTPRVIVPQSSNRKRQKKRITESVEHHGIYQSSPRGRNIVKRGCHDYLGSLRSKSSTVSSVVSIQHQGSINSNHISSKKRHIDPSIACASHRIERDQEQHEPVLLNSPREVSYVDDGESYELFQSPLPSARARHSMPPVTYRLNELESNQRYGLKDNQFYHPQLLSSHQPRMTPRVHQIPNQSPRGTNPLHSVAPSTRSIRHGSFIKSTVPLRSPKVSPRLGDRQQSSKYKDISSPAYDSRRNSQSVEKTRSPKAISKSQLRIVEETNHARLKSFEGISDSFTVSTLDENCNNQTLSTIASRGQIENNDRKLVFPSCDLNSSANSNVVVHRAWCRRRRKPRSVTDRYIRRALLTGMRLINASVPSRQSSCVMSTSSTIASSIQGSTEQLTAVKNNEHPSECKDCAARRKNQIANRIIANCSSTLSKPSRLLRILFCCFPCFVIPVHDMCLWIRQTVREVWEMPSN